MSLKSCHVRIGNWRSTVTAKKLIAVSALIVGATLGSGTTAFAQVYYNGPFGYSRPYQPNYRPYYPPGDVRRRGGPGPRVGDGTGIGIGAER